MQIPADAVNKAQISRLMAGHLTEADGISWIQVHPLFLYESIWCLALFLILLLYTKHRKYPGEIFLRYLAGYSLGRAGIEFLLPEPVTVPGTEIPVFVVCSACSGCYVWNYGFCSQKSDKKTGKAQSPQERGKKSCSEL